MTEKQNYGPPRSDTALKPQPKTPGQTLMNWMKKSEKDVEWLSVEIALPVNDIQGIIEDRVSITHSTACRLQRVTGVAVEKWMEK